MDILITTNIVTSHIKNILKPSVIFGKFVEVGP